VLHRAKMLAIVLAAAACGAPVYDSPSPPGQSASDRAGELARALDRHHVWPDAFARRTLYTWTTPDQIEALRASQRLLVRDTSPTHGASYVEAVLAALAAHGDPIATLLYSDGYARMRFAWPSPWATRAGFAELGETYGDQLIRIELKPEAIVVGVSTTRGVFDARDMTNARVPLADVARAPERIAAIYFESVRSGVPPAPIPQPRASYREYALCNEAMIESWSAGTPDIARELVDEAALLDAAAEAFGDARVMRAYYEALALRSKAYTSTGAPAAIAKLLRAAPMPAALHAKSTATFAGVGAPRAQPNVAPTWQGSYVGTYVRRRP
jgi:hypothetical protein